MKKIFAGVVFLVIGLILTFSVKALMTTTSVSDYYITAKGNHQNRLVVEPLTKLVATAACTTQAYDVFPYTQCCLYYLHYCDLVTDSGRVHIILQQSLDGSNWVRNAVDSVIILKGDTSHTVWKAKNFSSASIYPALYARFIISEMVDDSSETQIKVLWKE